MIIVFQKIYNISHWRHAISLELTLVLQGQLAGITYQKPDHLGPSQLLVTAFPIQKPSHIT